MNQHPDLGLTDAELILALQRGVATPWLMTTAAERIFGLLLEKAASQFKLAMVKAILK